MFKSTGALDPWATLAFICDPCKAEILPVYDPGAIRRAEGHRALTHRNPASLQRLADESYDEVSRAVAAHCHRKIHGYLPRRRAALLDAAAQLGAQRKVQAR